MFTRILVPTDFSEPSEAALDYARVLAGKFGASLHVLHVFDAPFAAGAVSPEGFIAESPDGAGEAVRRRQESTAAPGLAGRSTPVRATKTEIVTGTERAEHRQLRDGDGEWT